MTPQNLIKTWKKNIRRKTVMVVVVVVIVMMKTEPIDDNGNRTMVMTMILTMMTIKIYFLYQIMLPKRASVLLFQGALLFWQFKSRSGPVHRRLRRYLECPPLAGTQTGKRTTLLTIEIHRVHARSFRSYWIISFDQRICIENNQ